jgi:penicillin-insensitive murein DD-endopeptidase
VATPADGAPEPIGTYAAGCLRGGQALPPRGPGYEVVRLGRRRYFGHPELVTYVRRLGAKVRKARLERIVVGDLSQARGGPTPTGHRSHQTGLDVDIAFIGTPRPMGAVERERYVAPPVVDLTRAQLTSAWSARIVQVLALAADDPAVDRVFVHPAIKQALCTSPRKSAWLRRVRPWWGHHDHFHVRLACPAGSQLCQRQDPLPDNDGCGEELAWWGSEDARKTRQQRAAAAAPPQLPAACDDVLRNGRPTAM